jgi:multicomponent Na+:H+ antiporter subunit F
VTTATFVILALAAALFAYRLCIGPSLADRVLAVNGIVVVGMAALAVYAASTGLGSYLPTLIALALVGPISTGMIARYMEARHRDR